MVNATPTFTTVYLTCDEAGAFLKERYIPEGWFSVATFQEPGWRIEGKKSLGLELAEPSVRQADLALLRQLTGSAQENFQLRQRGLPWNLTRQLPNVAITVALADWADTIGQEQAIQLFTEAYTTAENQDHQTIMAALGIDPDTPVSFVHTGGQQ